MTDVLNPAPTSLTRTVDGAELPVAGRLEVDQSHSTVEFVARHMVTKVRGKFTDYDAEIEIAERPEDSRLAVTIQAASIDSGSDQRDGHLTSPDFLDVEQYPTISFVSTSVRPEGSNWKVDGDFTVHGVTRPLTLDVEFDGALTDPFGNKKAAFSASAEVNREDWGLTWNQALETGGVLVGKKVRIELAIEANYLD